MCVNVNIMLTFVVSDTHTHLCSIFAFAYMMEGASGFGTPVALGAPMLVSTGHAPLESVVILLIMNTFATVWGAGTYMYGGIRCKWTTVSHHYMMCSRYTHLVWL